MKEVVWKLVALGLAIGILVSGCGPAASNTATPPPPAAASSTATPVPAAPEEPLKVGYSAINLADAVMADFATRMKAEAKDLNIDLTLSDCGGDPAKQISDVESMVAAGNQVVVIQALNPEGMDPIVKEAMAKGVKVMAFGIGLNTYDAWYKNDNYAVGQGIGKMAGEWINENTDGNAKVALIEFPVVAVLIDRANGIEDGLKETAPNAEIVARGSAIESESGLELAETFLQQDPEIQVIVSISDGPALGAYEAIKAAGRDNEDFAIFGSDLSPVAVAHIAAGTAYRGTIDTDSKISPRKTMEMARALADGEPVDKITVMGVIPVTIDNITEYTAGAASTAKPTEGATTEEVTGGEAVTIRFSWWGSERRHDLTQQVIALYQESHPNVEFQVEFLSGPDYLPKLSSQAATKQMPDVFQTDVSWISTFTAEGLIADLQPYLDDGTIDTTNISSNVIASGVGPDGSQYAIPLALNTTSMLYDPEVFAEAGYDSIPFDWTWADYDAILTDVYEKTGVPALPLYYHIPEALVEVIARQAGKNFYTADGSALGFDADVILPMFQRILDLTKSGVYAPPDVWSTSNTTEDNGLVLGTASTAYGGSNQLVSYVSTAGRPLAMTSIPWAVENTGDPQGSSVKPSMMISIGAAAPNDVKAAAADFISFMINDEGAAKILQDERGVPVNSANREVVAADANETTQMVFEYVAFVEANAAPPPGWAPAKAREVYTVLVDLYQAVAFQVTTPEEAAEQFVSQANEILSTP
jgi:ABC-type sugar transport system substrate-binding protein/ABC-type glycerol-3-phosphate transport system substrate-binding protein